MLIWLALLGGRHSVTPRRAPLVPAAEGTAALQEHVGIRTILEWTLLSAIPSSLLLGVTTFLTSDVAAVPFLWVLPLTLYLGAFSLAFAGLAPVPFFRHAVGPGLAMTGLLIVGASNAGIPPYVVVALRSATFFLLTWACLAALYERRPTGAGLTAFYLWIAVGGVIGGAFNSIVAPLAFDTTAEYPLATLAAAGIGFVLPRRPMQGNDKKTDVNAAIGRATLMLAMVAATVYGISAARVRLELTAQQLAALLLVPIALCGFPRLFPIASCVGSGLVAGSVFLLSFGGLSPSESHRSFFGVHQIITPRPEFPTDAPFVTLMHGTTIHGLQFYDVGRRTPTRPDFPLAYYHRGGPLGAILAATRPKTLGVVGLGAGTIAAYAQAGQHLVYYEIDPLVIRIADGHPFTFLPAARLRGATVELVEGDARLTLGRSESTFDLLVLDAFSGDAIPAHLLTREAFALYAKRLAPGGTLAVHISNRYLDLSRVVASNAATIGGSGGIGDEGTWVVTELPPDGSQGSTWVYLTRDPAVAAKLTAPRWQPLPPTGPRDAWTDDYSNLLHTLR
jgi:SAM-dependent methyltransferase